jgi:hypothetical protein
MPPSAGDEERATHPFRAAAPKQASSAAPGRQAISKEAEPASTVRPEPAVSASPARRLHLETIDGAGGRSSYYSAVSYWRSPLQSSAPVITEPVQTLTSIEGLQVLNTSAAYDAKGDYVISGDIVNATDVERPAWLMVAEVFDANGALLGTARMLNNVKYYTNRDYEILAKRGTMSRN